MSQPLTPEIGLHTPHFGGGVGLARARAAVERRRRAESFILGLGWIVVDLIWMLVWFGLEEKCLLRRMKMRMRMRRSLGESAVLIYFDLGLFLDLLPGGCQAERESVCDRRCHL